jgi:transposase-like protein
MTAAGRTLSDDEVLHLTENEARRLFSRARWPGGRPVCIQCSSPRCSPRTRPGYYRCSDCRKDFSVTSGTTLQSHKLPLRRVLAAIFYLVVFPHGISSATLSVLMALSPNTALILLHRIRESIAGNQINQVLSGEVEIDGIYFSFRRRRPNVGRRSLPDLHAPTRKVRCVLTLAQRGGPVIPILVEGESSRAILAAVQKHIAPGTKIFTDDLSSYDFLHAFFKVNRINHSIHYAEGNTHTNNAESYHARCRRSARGVLGRFSSGDDFMLYMHELAFKHSARQMDTRSMWEAVVQMMVNQPVSDRFCGYWQAIRSSIAA